VTFIKGIWAKTFAALASIAKRSLNGVAQVLSLLFGVDVKAALKQALEDAKAAVAEARAGVTAPGTTTTQNDTKDKKDDPLDPPLVPTVDDSTGKGKGAGKDKTNDLLKQQQEAYESIRQSQLRSLSLEGTQFELQKDLLQNRYDYEDAVDEINKTVAAGNQAELKEYQKLLKIDQDRLAFKRAQQRDIAEAEKVESLIAPLREEKRLLDATLAGRLDEEKLLINIEKTQAGIPEAQRASVEALIRGNDELSKQAVKAQELKDAFTEVLGQVSARIQSGIVEGINAAIDGSKSLQEILSNVLKDIGQIFLKQAVGSAVSLIPGFAEGGRPPLNKVSLIGEEGPELFVPDSAGTVISNADAFGAARGAMGGRSIQSSDAFDENSDSISTTNNFMRERSMERNTETTVGGGGTMVIETQVINNVEYATLEQVRVASDASAKKARAQVFSDMKNKPSRRAAVGLK
jgi:hypothetical protein